MPNKKIVKIVGIIILIIIAIYLVCILRNIIIIKKIQKKMEPYLSSQNYHIKSVLISNETNEIEMTVNFYKKDAKNLTVIEKNQDGKDYKISIYDNGQRTDMFWDIPGGKIVQLDTEKSQTIELYNYFQTGSAWETIIASMSADIKSGEYNNKKCYIIDGYKSSLNLNDQNINKTYIEKDTGLLLKLETSESINDREYEFNNVSEEMLKEPDIGDYKLRK